MFKTWRPPEEYADTEANKQLGGLGLRSALSSVDWLPTAPGAIYLSGGPFLEGGGGARGRFRIAYTPTATVKAVTVHIVDESADVNYPDGYQEFNYPDYNDGAPLGTPRHIDLSATTFRPPLVLYVSSLRHEKRLLVITPYTAWDATEGEASGTALTALTLELSPPPEVSAQVDLMSPEGQVRSRWRQVSFGLEPMDWPLLIGDAVGAGEIASATRLTTDAYQFPDGTFAHRGDHRNDVYLVRTRHKVGGVSGFFPGAWQGQAQVRRVVEAGTDGGGDGYIEYERPFEPALAEGDEWFVTDKVVMVRISQSPRIANDSVAEWVPVWGRLWLDTWAMAGHRYNSVANYAIKTPHIDYARRYLVEYYYHDANYGPYGQVGDGDETQQLNAPRFESAIGRLDIRPHAAPWINRVRIMESDAVVGDMRVEIEDLKGDVNRWRLYARGGTEVATEWPTVDPEFANAEPDEAYFLGEFDTVRQRWAEIAAADYDITATDVTRVLVVPVTFDGEWAPATAEARLNNPETAAIIHSVTVVPEDTGSDPNILSNHRLTWQTNGPANDALLAFRIEHHRENHEGIWLGENPTVVLVSGTNLASTNDYLHEGDTAGALIDKRSGNVQNTYIQGTYVVTHVYELVLSNGGTELCRVRKTFTDRYHRPNASQVTLGTAHLTLKEGSGVVDDQGRVVEPLTIDAAIVGAKGLEYYGTLTNDNARLHFEWSRDGLATSNPAKSWLSLGVTPMSMSLTGHTRRIQIWDKVHDPGGTNVDIDLRVYYKHSADSFVSRQGTIFATRLTVPMSDVVAPGPF